MDPASTGPPEAVAARYYRLDGWERSKSFARKLDAERWLSAQLVDLDRGQWVDPELGRISWASYSQQLLAGRCTSPPGPERPSGRATPGQRP